MKVTKYEVKALENVLDCMHHYMLIGHIEDEHSKAEWNSIRRAVRRMEVLHEKMKDSFLNE
jgi:hypothetical protein